MHNPKLSLRDLLMAEAAKLAGSQEPDLPVGFELTRLSRQAHGCWRKYDSIVASAEVLVHELEVNEAQELHLAHRKLAAGMLQQLRGQRGLNRLAKACRSRYLNPELRAWARKQLAKLSKLGRKPNGFTVGYLVMVLEDSIEFEREQSAEYVPTDAMSMEQARYVEARTLNLEFTAKQEGPHLRRVYSARRGASVLIATPEV